MDDRVGARRAREDGLKAWLASRGDAGKAQTAAIAALEQELAAQRATRERDQWFNGAVGGGLAGVAVQLYRNAIEQAKPDAERESGFQERDAPRMEGRLKSMDKRYDAKVDNAIMALRLHRSASRVPAGQRVTALDEWLGIGAGDKALPGLDAKLAEIGRGPRREETRK